MVAEANKNNKQNTTNEKEKNYDKYKLLNSQYQLQNLTIWHSKLDVSYVIRYYQFNSGSTQLQESNYIHLKSQPHNGFAFVVVTVIV